MSTIGRVFSSSVGTKLLIGLTGIGLFVYMILHLAGNVLIFAGPDTFNAYSHTLISNPLLLPVEIGLLAIFLLHVYKAVTNYVSNTAARPIGYAKKERAHRTSRKSVASSTMIWSGLVVFVFVVIHVWQFRFGTYYETGGEIPMRDLARTEFEVFSHPGWVALYVAATLLVGLHLRHGISSSFQSIGLDHPVYTRRLTTWGIVLAVLIGGGLAIIPVWAYLMH
jgi:succinate dehydrogenase / fumarate reductase, cytochrome b subunit